MDVEKLFAKTPTESHFGDEADFKRAWQDIAATDSLFALAFQGGALADRLSFVFLGAYQAAVRHCFPAATGSRLYCFAASEDRSGTLAGTSTNAGRLSGTKTWIAASDCIDSIIVTVDSTCVMVDARAAGVSLDSGEPKGFLPDLSQGKAHFHNAAFEPVEMQGDFGLAEAFYVTCAATGFLARETAQVPDSSQHRAALQQAATLSTLYESGIDSDLALLTDTYHAVKEVGKTIAASASTASARKDWEQNGRLLGMYGKRLPK